MQIQNVQTTFFYALTEGVVLNTGFHECVYKSTYKFEPTLETYHASPNLLSLPVLNMMYLYFYGKRYKHKSTLYCTALYVAGFIGKMALFA